jgi:hypothetical protein
MAIRIDIDIDRAELGITDPGIVRMQLTRLLLCMGRISNDVTDWVRRAMPLPAILEPVSAPVAVITAAPPALTRMEVPPETPMVANAAPNPTPITGARRPAEIPMTRPPPAKYQVRSADTNLKVTITQGCKSHHDIPFPLARFNPPFNSLTALQRFNAFLNLERICHALFKSDHFRPSKSQFSCDILK